MKVSSPNGKRVVIVGAGMCGPLMAIYLARRGHQVEIYERRADPRRGGGQGGRSIKMTLAEKGLWPLRELGLDAEVLARTVPLRGRALHGGDGKVSYQLYGNQRDEVIYSITRTDLNTVLLDATTAWPEITVRFGMRCLHLDKHRPKVLFRDERTREKVSVEADTVIGADGANSVVRRNMHRDERADYHQEFLAWGYKELTIEAGPGGVPRMDPNALHLWPRGDFILFALPNLDGSFNAVCTLPYEGRTSFATIQDDDQVLALFRSHFPDALPLMPRLLEDFRNRVVNKFVTIRTSRWHHHGRVVLLGDACHTVVPFYGQGMNAALEDCAVLDRCLEKHPDRWDAAFARFQALRKRHTDVLAELSHRNFVELRDTARSAVTAARKQTSLWLNRRFPDRYVPIYTLVTHTELPYADCIDRAATQDRMLRRCGFSIVVGAVATAIRIGHLWGRLRPRRAGAGRGPAVREAGEPGVQPLDRPLADPAVAAGQGGAMGHDRLPGPAMDEEVAAESLPWEQVGVGERM
jgi:kynurenine 3-monooxygenase